MWCFLHAISAGASTHPLAPCQGSSFSHAVLAFCTHPCGAHTVFKHWCPPCSAYSLCRRDTCSFSYRLAVTLRETGQTERQDQTAGERGAVENLHTIQTKRQHGIKSIEARRMDKEQQGWSYNTRTGYSKTGERGVDIMEKRMRANTIQVKDKWIIWKWQQA